MKIKIRRLIIAVLILLVGVSLLYYWKVNIDIARQIKSDEELEAYMNEHFGNYDKIEEIAFEERFGSLTGNKIIRVKVIITKDDISYEIIPDLALQSEQNIFLKEIDEKEWQILLGIMRKYHLEDWKERGDYLYVNYSDGPSHHIKNEEIEYVREGDFFNINSSEINDGVDENELKYRSNYDGSMVISSGEPDYYFFRGPFVGRYENYGVPLDYNEFRQEFWDFIIEYTEGDDWRIKLEQVGQEVMHQIVPYMTE